MPPSALPPFLPGAIHVILPVRPLTVACVQLDPLSDDVADSMDALRCLFCCVTLAAPEFCVTLAPLDDSVPATDDWVALPRCLSSSQSEPG